MLNIDRKLSQHLFRFLFLTILLISCILCEQLQHEDQFKQQSASFDNHQNINEQTTMMQKSDNYARLADKNNQNLQFLSGEDYIGTYTRTNQQSLFDYLSSSSGTIQALLYKDPFVNSQQTIDTFVLFMFDPIYHDQKAIEVKVLLNKMVSPVQWSSTNSVAQVSLYWKQRSDGPKNISNVSYRIILANIYNSNPKQVQIYIQFYGPNFSFNAKLAYDDARLSTLGYSLYTSGVVFIQIISAYFLLKKIDSVNPNIVNKISLTTMAICNIQDFYLTMINIEYIMRSSSDTYLFFILPSLGYITLFVIFDMKLLFLAWRSHYMRQIQNPQALRKKLTTFYIKFYVGLFVYLTLTYFFSFDVWMIILQNLIMIPQIVHNTRVGINPGFQPLFVIGYLGARFLIPLYERACPSNHFMLTPIIGLVIALFLLYTFQILFLFVQYSFGPRFFVPRIFLPNYYNYNYKLKLTQQNKDTQCSICLQNFFAPNYNSIESLNINSSQIQQTILKQYSVMKTPCNHYFHRECLVNWADVKLQCPTCRAPLSPI